MMHSQQNVKFRVLLQENFIGMIIEDNAS